MDKFNLDPKATNISGLFGISEKRADEIFEANKQIMKDADNGCEAIEKVNDTYSGNELGFSMMMVGTFIGQMQSSDPIEQLMRMMQREGVQN